MRVDEWQAAGILTIMPFVVNVQSACTNILFTLKIVVCLLAMHLRSVTSTKKKKLGMKTFKIYKKGIYF